MKQVELYLIPQPGAKPEFLATLTLALTPLDVDNPSSSPVDVIKVWNDSKLPTKVVLEGYTRDGWAWKPSTAFVNLRVQSVDGRKKLAGFVKYLSERQKSAYGRMEGGGIWAISYIQSNTKEALRMDCRIALDMTLLKDCSLKPLLPKQPQISSAAQVQPIPKPKPSTRKKGGLLGQLVGAQQQTNRHMEATSNKAKTLTVASGGGTSTAASASTSTSSSQQQAPTALALRTAPQVLSEFRETMQQKMLDFDMLESEDVLQIAVSMGEQTAGLSTADKEKVTMDVLKYMVYEAAEEVNEEWIAFKEPSEFMDEANFTIYKEGAAPLDVLEEMNKGELPDEIRLQQRAMATERHRQAHQAESKKQKNVLQQAHRSMDEEDEEDLEALNTKKRDRRTVEDYEREKKKIRP